jgi:hypothetical protein
MITELKRDLGPEWAGRVIEKKNVKIPLPFYLHRLIFYKFPNLENFNSFIIDVLQERRDFVGGYILHTLVVAYAFTGPVWHIPAIEICVLGCTPNIALAEDKEGLEAYFG